MKVLLKGIGVLLVLIVAFGLFIQLSYQQDFSEEYPVNEDLKVETTAARIAHGEYLAYGPAHCATCHVPVDKIAAVEAGEKVAMIGGGELTLPPGILRAPNLTPDPETGIGNLSDGELYRMLRYNIMHDGTTTIELMPFSTMSDEDIYSIIAYLRSQEPVHHEVAASDWTFLGKALKRFVIKPIDDGKSEHPPIQKGANIAYGKYLAESVANCRGCHTERDLKSGAFTGPEYAGGLHFDPSPETQGWAFNTPNLTPCEKTGIMKGWSKEAFMQRIRNGRTQAGSPMPWGTFSRMDSTDLEALWLFLSSLEPVENSIEQIAFAPES